MTLSQPKTSQRLYLIFIGLILFGAVAILTAAAFFAHPVWDDFCYGAAVAADGVYAFVRSRYFDITGKYGSLTLIGVLFSSLGAVEGHTTITILIIASTLAAFCYFCSVVLQTHGRYQSLACGALLFTLYALSIRAIESMFYWSTGGIVYQIGFNLILVLVGYLIHIGSTPTARIPRISWGLVPLLAFVIAGFHELTMVLFLFILGIGMLISWIENSNTKYLWLAALLAGVIGGAFLYLAPGTQNKAGTGFDIGSAMIIGVQGGGIYLGYAIMGLLLIYKLLPAQLKPQHKFALTSIVSRRLLLLAMFCVPLLAFAIMGGAFAADELHRTRHLSYTIYKRSHVGIYFILICGLFWIVPELNTLFTQFTNRLKQATAQRTTGFTLGVLIIFSGLYWGVGLGAAFLSMPTLSILELGRYAMLGLFFVLGLYPYLALVRAMSTDSTPEWISRLARWGSESLLLKAAIVLFLVAISNFGSFTNHFYTGKMQNYHQVMEARYETIAEAKTTADTNVTVPSLVESNSPFLTIMRGDIAGSPDYWTNSCYAYYFDIESIGTSDVTQ